MFLTFKATNPCVPPLPSFSSLVVHPSVPLFLIPNKRNRRRPTHLSPSLPRKAISTRQRQTDSEFEGEVEDADSALESEIYDFMLQSNHPNDFPTKDELIASGRMDLVEKIALQGGWFAFGWDLDQDKGASSRSLTEEMNGSFNADDRMSHHRSRFSLASEDGRALNAEVKDNAGLEGILSRLEKERILSHSPALGSREKESKRKLSADDDIFLSETRINWRNSDKFSNDALMGDEEVYKLGKLLDDVADGRKEAQSDFKEKNQNQIESCLQHLELGLTSVLRPLKSRADADVAPESSMKEIHRLSDAWEFKETEIMNTRGKLRSLRASLTVLEGKMALKNIDAQGIVEEKQWKIDYAQKALQLLRTACIVWPNPASEVWLAGSFDGWTSQILHQLASEEPVDDPPWSGGSALKAEVKDDAGLDVIQSS
ncbi:hypothetical protein QJS10_CPB22g01171 [Acorus calamus]|uniref:Uncharacterized protein n=1 Tax=Acorus calamus TaxID=4465 RepID=A0AAV9C0Q4_ACOCL|nr:hypothetical protein QJS10_CPB22g01171 [Acorus calamus]